MSWAMFSGIEYKNQQIRETYRKVKQSSCTNDAFVINVQVLKQTILNS